MKRILIIAVLALVIAGLGVTVLLLGKSDAAPVQERETAEYIINSAQDGDISRIAIKNESGEYEILAPAQGGEGLFIPGLEDLKPDSFFLSVTRSRLSFLMSQGSIAGGEDLAPFGLSEPRAVVKVSFADGGERTIFIGNDAPDGANTYTRILGKEGVYLAARRDLENCLLRSLDFVDKTIVEVQGNTVNPSGEGVPPEFERIELGGAFRRDEPVRIVKTEGPPPDRSGIAYNPYQIVQPVHANVSIDKGLPNLEALFDLKAIRVVHFLTDPGELVRYGLAEPYSTATVLGTLGSGLGGFSLRASAPGEDGRIYLLREGVPLIYEVASDTVPWLELSFFDLMDKLVILPFIDNVARLEVYSPDISYTFTLSGEGDGLVVQAGGETIDTANFRTLYQTVLTAMYESYTRELPEAGSVPLLEIRYHYRDGKPVDKLSFYPAIARRVLLSYNGRRPFYTYSAYVDKVLTDCAQVLAGKKVRSYI
ncbi:MAG: DUF4340 domain-containing protein [Treponema sp.]|jgi:hypothetical protein|nr:DUF4340 domain-containing protein [Treponema sp.]